MKHFFLFCLIWIASLAGSENALFAQDVLSRLQGLFEQGVSRSLQEKVYLDTDKCAYTSGETIWFQAYCLDAALHTYSGVSQVVYVELVDAMGEAQIQEKIRLESGIGQGHIYLNPDLLGGNYRLIAYTQWMKNSDPAFFFKQDIFLFNPLGEAELITQKGSETAQVFALPEAVDRGWVMAVEKGPPARNYEIVIRGTKTVSTPVYILVHSRGILRFLYQQLVSQGKARFILPVDSLAAGINHITVFNEALEPICERLLFQPPPRTIDLAVQLEPGPYKRRSEVNWQLSGSFAGKAKLSVSVYKYNPEDTETQPSFPVWLYLTSDLREGNPRVAAYVEAEGRFPASAVDLLMLSRTWSRFEWAGILAEKSPRIIYPPELHAPLLSGVLRMKDPRAELPPKVYISMTGDATRSYVSFLDSTGRFFLQISPQLSPSEIFFHLGPGRTDAFEIGLQNDFWERHAPVPAGQRSGHIAENSFLQQMSINTQIANAYVEASYIRGETPDAAGKEAPFYGFPDVVYRLDEYTRFPLLDDIFSEYVKEAVKRKIDQKKHLFLYDLYGNMRAKTSNQTLDGPAQVMLDGVAIADMDAFWAIDPLSIEAIHLVTREFCAGDAVFSGLVNLISYRGKVHQWKEKGLLMKRYQGLQEKRRFYSPVYEGDSQTPSRVPDMRSTLFWQGGLELREGEVLSQRCYTGDDTGHYRIEVSGLSDQGIPLHGSATFQVHNH